jgi:hypothetical protein
MNVLAAVWLSLRPRFFRAARRPRLERTEQEPLSLIERIRLFFWLWREWLTRSVCVHCDHPTLGVEDPPQLNGTVEIHGWALAIDGIESITVTCDGEVFGKAALGVRRPDLRNRFPYVRRAGHGGFFFSLDTRSLADGARELSLIVRTRGGRVVEQSGTVQVANAVTT